MGKFWSIIDTSLLHVIAVSEWIDGVVKYFHYKELEITCQH